MFVLPQFRLVECRSKPGASLSLAGMAPVEGPLAFDGQSGQAFATLATLLRGGQDANIGMLMIK